VTNQSIQISEARHGNKQHQKKESEESKDFQGDEVDQDGVLPAKRKRSTNERAGASNGFTSPGGGSKTNQGEPSMEASMNRKTKRSSVVKNPRNVSPREESVGSDQGTITANMKQPFGKKTSAATHLPS